MFIVFKKLEKNIKLFINFFKPGNLTNVWNFGVLGSLFLNIQIVIKKIKLFLNNIVLNFFVKNCNKFTFIFFNFFLIISLIILFYYSTANIYCQDDIVEIKECDYFYITKDRVFFANIPSMSGLGPLCEDESLYDKLETLIDWKYQRQIQNGIISFDSYEKNLEKKEFDYIYITKDKQFMAYIPSLSYLTDLYLTKSIDELEEKISRANESISYQRTFVENNFFDPEMNLSLCMDLSVCNNPDVTYKSSDIIIFEKFVKKEVDKCSKEPDYEKMKLSETVNKIFKAVLAANASDNFSENLFKLPVLDKNTAEKIIYFEIYYDYLNKSYENNSKLVNLILKKKVESRRDVVNAVRDLIRFEGKISYDEVFFGNFRPKVESVRNIHSQTSIFLEKNNFACHEFHSKLVNESILLYAPNPIYFQDKSKQTVWFQLLNNSGRTYVYFYIYDGDADIVRRYLAGTFNYAFDLKNKKLSFEYCLNGKNRENFYADFKSKNRIITTRISFLGEEKVQIQVNDHDNKLVQNINLLNGEYRKVN